MSSVEHNQLHTVLTGDRPTGNLHVGHYVGSIKNRIELQDKYKTYIMIADTQALSDNFDNPDKVKENIYSVCRDYLACGIDPDKSIIFLQSQVSALFELTCYYMNLVTVARLERNPTVKAELAYRQFVDSIPAGFLCYPVSQVADITAFKATLIPVGNDQLPMIELSNEIVRKFNRTYCCDVLKESTAILSDHQRLVGIDGQAKASKSLNNAIFLVDNKEVLRAKINAMYTDPGHIKVSDPGRVEGNVVFAYLDAFHNDKSEVEDLKTQYRKGGLGDMALKNLLFNSMNTLLEPIRERSDTITNEYIRDVLIYGSNVASVVAKNTLEEVRSVIGMFT